MASTFKKVTQERNDKNHSQGGSNKASYLKNDAEFKKIFGLTKDLRVCLTRIPDNLGSGEGFDSFSKSDTYKETELIVKEEKKKQVIDFCVLCSYSKALWMYLLIWGFFSLCINRNNSCYQTCIYVYFIPNQC